MTLETGGKVAEVAITGWSWSTGLIAILNLLVGGALVAWIRARPKMRELAKEADEKLRDDLIARVDKLETKAAEKDAQHEAVVAVLRHRVNNVTQCLDALLLLIEQDPARAAEAAAKIRQMREKQTASEAMEKAAIYAAPLHPKIDPAE